MHAIIATYLNFGTFLVTRCIIAHTLMGNSEVFMNFEPIKICSCIIGDANLTNFKINYALLLGNLRSKQQSGRYGMKHKNTVEGGRHQQQRNWNYFLSKK